MADTLTTKKVTELTENTAMSDDDLFMVGSAGTASLRKLKWANIWNTIKTAILGKLVANNLTTTEAGYLLDARQGKALDDKISKLNTDTKWKYVGKVTGLNTALSVAGLSDVQEFRCLISFFGNSTGTTLMKVMNLVAGKAGTYVAGYKYDSKYYGSIALQYTTGDSTIMINGSWTKVYGNADVSQAGATLEVWYR